MGGGGGALRPIRRQLGNAGGVSGRNAGGVAKAASVTAGVGGEAAITVIVTSAVVAGVDFTVVQALLSGAGRGQPAGGTMVMALGLNFFGSPAAFRIATVP